MSGLVLVPLLLVLTLFLFNILRHRSYKRGSRTPPPPPEPSGGLPIVGHLLQIVTSKKTLARALADMADRHGPIITIRIGTHRAIVVSESKTVQECFTTHDRALASRPESSQAEYLNYSYAGFGSAPYGSYWRDVRKIAVTRLLSGQRIKSHRHVQVSEIEMLMNELHVLCQSRGDDSTVVVVVMSELLEQLGTNMITRLIARKRYFNYRDSDRDAGEGIGELIKEFMRVCGEIVMSDLIPCMGWMNWFPGPLKSMKKIGKELDEVMQSWIEEHKLNKKNKANSNVEDEEEEEGDFIDLMLSAIGDDFSDRYTPETIIKATALTLILAGADTTSITITWVLSNLLNNKPALNLAQHELDTKVGRTRHVRHSDIENLPYLQAIVKETLRLYPPAPTAVPHQAIEDCTIRGYHVAKGTRVFTNLWKIHRDPAVWSDPDEFKPERFMGGHNGPELIPFGLGRRSCPGTVFALQVVSLTVARLLQGFGIASRDGVPVDMGEGLGLTMPRATPLEVRLTPRLAAEFYRSMINK